MAAKLLIIDDNPQVLAVLCSRLAGEGYDLRSAADGASGLQAALDDPPDCILLDLDMPSPDGLEVCRRLKLDLATSAVPVILMTGLSQPQSRRDGLEAGAMDYVVKPCDPVELKARVRAAVRMNYLTDLLTHRAQMDIATGLWNRAYFDKRLSAERSSALRHRTALSCLRVELSGAQQLLQRKGLGVLEAQLKQDGELISKLVREEDVVCRYGPASLAILMPDTPEAGARRLAERLRTALTQEHSAAGRNTPWIHYSIALLPAEAHAPADVAAVCA